ncbi:putative ATP-dependent helicase DinG [Ephemeroptericola cinctiostellae]|uniref:Putative ATP-dependent helicase DinG n=1 Tax=Ephemeroptericola cinctiostellae TaxID=2268024 RepID=A0A345DAC0_9BURK|nr:ATP-dependent DNA helicase [Ephemeroptericola cinctiostellae]AXF85308.1 putative ATP-dependent helicase DinG [Ephemeroptericola cinctiostellae]
MSDTENTSPNSASSLPFEQQNHLSRIFGEGGSFAQRLPHYHSRQEQIQMAEAVTHALNKVGCAVLEAGTGTGKTFAYLAPALMWGGKVIVSTGTKTLQDQLFERDLPTVRDVLAAPVSITLLKGRSNYVCHYHLERTLMNGRLFGREDVKHLNSIKKNINLVKRGDKAEWPEIPDDAQVWAQVTSTRENCLGSDCPNHKECFVMQARKDAQAADVVVVNHHLFFADVMLREEGIAELLPAANTVIFDEAHQVPDIASVFFGQQVTSAQIIDLARDLLAEGITHARDALDWSALKDTMERAAKDFRIACGDDNGRWSVSQLPTDSPLWGALDTMLTILNESLAKIEPTTVRAETLAQCAERLSSLIASYEQWQGQTGSDMVRWVEALTYSVRLNATPLSVAESFTRQRESDHMRTWIFASATLSVKKDFSLFTEQLGLSDATTASWDSPFDYANQGLLYVPDGLPEPSNRAFGNAMLAKVWPVLQASNGRAFLLCTTLAAVKRYAAWLDEQIKAHDLPWTLLVQGTASRTEILNQYRAATNPVLVGSQSFWEGVDVRGEALSVVIIDKLPFAPPDDPVLAARLKAIEERGENGFMAYQVPQAVISLKQGAGRLIRSETDKGVLMICDTRLISKPYGRRIWQSLPSFARTRQEDVVQAFFNEKK